MASTLRRRWRKARQTLLKDQYVKPLYIRNALHMSREELEDEIRCRVQSVYVGDNVVLARVLGRQKMYLRTDDVGFAGHLMLDGYWESWLTKFLCGICEPGMTAVDVGANFGYYSVLLGDIVANGGHLFAVEPNPVAAALLKRTLELNGLSGHTTLFAGALGDGSCAEVEMIVPPGEPKNAYVAGGVATGERIRVPCKALDEMLEDVPRVDLIKIDAEGSEEAIVRGGAATLSRHRPHLVVEYNGARYHEPKRFLEAILDFYGKVHTIEMDGSVLPRRPSEIFESTSGEDVLLYFARR